MEPAELREDLKHEIFLILCELPEEKFNEVKDFRHFLVRIIINQVQSVNSPFYKKYRKIKMVELLNDNSKYQTDHPIEEINDIVQREEIARQCDKAISSLHWYDEKIMREYIEIGSLRGVALSTGIPFTSVAGTVRKARKQIKKTLVYG